MGVVGVLAVVALRQDLPDGADAALIGPSLVTLKDQTFLLVPAFCAGFGNGLLVGYRVYRSGLVPRPMGLIGLIGGLPPALRRPPFFSHLRAAVRREFLFTAPEIAWEASLGVWLVTKGLLLRTYHEQHSLDYTVLSSGVCVVVTSSGCSGRWRYGGTGRRCGSGRPSSASCWPHCSSTPVAWSPSTR
ncbi:DUF4386 domain-containing protein [Actinomadura sp. KC06]|nr:DUF4386 domain-containing protein [Actinomadura sp. KC06]